MKGSQDDPDDTNNSASVDTPNAAIRTVEITSDGEVVEGDQFFVVVYAPGVEDVTMGSSSEVTVQNGALFTPISDMPEILVKMYGLDDSGTHVMLIEVAAGAPLGPMTIAVELDGVPGLLSTTLDIIENNKRTNRNFYLFPGPQLNYVGLGLIPSNSSLTNLMGKTAENSLGNVTLGEAIVKIAAFDFETTGGSPWLEFDPTSGSNSLTNLSPYQGMLILMKDDAFDETEDGELVPIKMKIEGRFFGDSEPVTQLLRFGFNLVAPHIVGDLLFKDAFHSALIPSDKELVVSAITVRQEVIATTAEIITEDLKIQTRGEIIEPEFAYWLFINKPSDGERPTLTPAD